ncbi:hypothetical protein Tcan_06862 [Toxocara canis]|uniref:Uncharacterized protein n=1 Tax=Toxocara canis TaxID=6265 RepID=A0A0B2VGS7_TOXCA|nr:hypothetical protein Tcan_06862 [Toxocara canis]
MNGNLKSKVKIGSYTSACSPAPNSHRTITLHQHFHHKSHAIDVCEPHICGISLLTKWPLPEHLKIDSHFVIDRHVKEENEVHIVLCQVICATVLCALIDYFLVAFLS